MNKVLEESGIVVVNDSSRIEYNRNAGGGDKEVMNKIIVPTGGEYNLILSDGTWVYLECYHVSSKICRRETGSYFGGRSVFSSDRF